MLNRLITTVFYIGHLRPAPGTWGSAAAIPLAWVLHAYGGFPLLLVATVAVFLAGWAATAAYQKQTGTHDASEIVVDEIVGQWIALLPLSGGLWAMGHAGWLFPWPGWVGAFLMFRLFDIWKPGPIGWADRRDDALGVMLDDVIAGVFAAIAVSLAAAVSHGLLR